MYSGAETAAFAARARSAGLAVHLDGARLSNALAAANARVSQLSWTCGVDVLTLGLTKTGAMGCEIIILFGKARERFPELRVRAKRAGHMPPKMRFLAAQAEAMLTGGLWLKLAAHANAMAAQLSSVFSAASVDHAYPAQGNEVFVNLAPDQIASLRAQGAAFLEWTSGSCRFVCSWTTTEDEIRALGAALARR